LVAQYSFSGNANDTTGANNGTLVGAPAYTTDRHGSANSAILLNGSTQYMQLPNEPTFEFTSFTIYAIFCAASFPGSDLMLVGKPPATAGFGTYSLFLQTVGAVTELSYAHDLAAGGNYSAGNQALSAGQWYQGAITYDGVASTLTGYNAGAVGYTLTAVGAPAQNTNAALIGASTALTAYFNGAIDEVLIYNRVLSAAEITQAYTALQ
jgi:hypothetical protein